MSLLWPIALLGLITLPLILFLHLLRSQRERLPIPSLLLWYGLQQEKEGGAPRKIPLSLMLVLQLLIATALTLGLARPVVSFFMTMPQLTIFVLDMSTSMTATDVAQIDAAAGLTTRFDVARQAIKAHVEGMNGIDQVAVVSLGPRPEILLTGSGEQKAAALLALDNLVPGASGANLTAALSLAGGLVDPEIESQIIVLTDGNYAVDSEPLPPILAPIEWRFIPAAPASAGNQALFNVSSRALPDGRHRIFSRVINYSDSPVVRTLRLTVDGREAGQESLEIEPQADGVQLWTVSAQAEAVTVEIVEPDVLPLDNRADLLLLDTTRRQVLLVSETPDALAKALEVQPGVELTTISPEALAGRAVNEFDLIVLEEPPAELNTWPQGNVWLVNPPLNHPLLPAETTAVNLRPETSTASTILDGADLSGVYFGRVTRLAAPEWATVDLLATADTIENPVPLIFNGLVDNSRVVVWTFDLQASNLPARLALPLLTANTLATLLAPSLPPAIEVGQPVSIAGNFTVETPEGQRLFLDEHPGNVSENRFAHTKNPGLYRIYDRNNTLVAGFAVHAGSALESNLGLGQDQPDVQAALSLAPLPPPDRDLNFTEFWPWLAGLALTVILAEGWLAWRR